MYNKNKSIFSLKMQNANKEGDSSFVLEITEIIERILSYVTRYEEIGKARCVNKLWYILLKKSYLAGITKKIIKKENILEILNKKISDFLKGKKILRERYFFEDITPEEEKLTNNYYDIVNKKGYSYWLKKEIINQKRKKIIGKIWTNFKERDKYRVILYLEREFNEKNKSQKIKEIAQKYLIEIELPNINFDSNVDKMNYLTWEFKLPKYETGFDSKKETIFIERNKILILIYLFDIYFLKKKYLSVSNGMPEKNI